MVKLEQVTKKFDTKIAVNNLSLEIQEGEIFGLLGENGARKNHYIKNACYYAKTNRRKNYSMFP